LQHIVQGLISNPIAKEVLQMMWEANSLDEELSTRLIEEKGLQQISAPGELEALIDQVLLMHPELVEEYQSGKVKAFNALVGRVMKTAKGQANPQQVNTLIAQKIEIKK
jgi:aspartyl-tRNA(Asn)/glutamyl-tRNA(Gln) amidotransferase subunit B